ncbi:hypothetical protein Lesp02_69850 [Lentzea sp. NBRC 105346]|uniref:DUF1700 domain-containing protein n=1 Tax=Lentzea sp. NBRC 105346 TaxID=3032205 RepID=UPI0024A20D43|nr:hypothetical protein [Lentzea sp. NBRC 105346]GLZ34798.1 hypothetical protein Lesp02_69850 [Lentzea sp. NBRC 105346]
MNTQQARLGVEGYLAGMRAALADLPPAEVAEIMEDVEAHVSEIAAELGEGETLEQRLGSPEAYAQELRTAAGYPARTEVIKKHKITGKLTKSRIAVWGFAAAVVFTVLAGTVSVRDPEPLILPAIVLALSFALIHEQGPELAKVRALPEVQKAKELLNQPVDTPAGKALAYLRSLQPAWWLLRTLLLVLAAVLMTRRDLLAFVLVVALAAAAFYGGPKSKSDRRWLWVTLPASALAAAVILGLIDIAADSVRLSSNSYPSYQVYQERYENIYPFDSNGKPLEGVLLFDQDGKAINAPDVGGQRCPNAEPVIPANKYPRPKIDWQNGQCVTIPPSISQPPPASSEPPTSSSAPPSSSSVAPPSPSK